MTYPSVVGGVDEKTFRKWAWLFVVEISFLEPEVVRNYVFVMGCIISQSYGLSNNLSKIVWEKRRNGDIGNDCLVSVDGTDFEIRQKKPFSKAWYSHKFHGPGLRYEVGLSILGGDIVWINGPYQCGAWPDIKIFRDGIIYYLDENERVEADDGYRGEDPAHARTPGGFTNDTEHDDLQQRVRSRHETVNKRFKQWGCLYQRFRHSDLTKHSAAFRAVAVITQLSIEHGEPLFSVEYKR
jgi:hypothetical protein